MGSNKPRIQALLEPKEYEKFKILCKRDERSESKLGGMIIRQYLEQYEKIHGEIHIEKE